METSLRCKEKINPANLVALSGASAVLEMLAFCLADPGDAFIIPSPYYSGFDRDLGWRPQVEVVPAVCTSETDFLVTREALEEAWASALQQGRRVRALLISSPSNPTGQILSKETLVMLLDFSRDKGIHLISDEIYAGSVHAGSEFISIANIAGADLADSQRIHIVHGLSKDLGLPGLRVGVLFTQNKTVLGLAKKLARTCSVSSQSQELLVKLLADTMFMQSFLKENQRRLREGYNAVTACLRKAGISWVPASAGQYVWLNLAALMKGSEEDAEVQLLQALVLEAGLVLNPGSEYHSESAGWFRLCFAIADEKTLATAMLRLLHFARGR